MHGKVLAVLFLRRGVPGAVCVAETRDPIRSPEF